MPTRILIADANRDRATELAIRCERLDAVVRREIDSRAVVECVRQWRPHLVLLDSSMRLGRRRRMCEHMVRDPQWRHCRLIALSTPDDHRVLQEHDQLLIYSLRPQEPMWQRIEAVLDELLVAPRGPMRPIDYLFDTVLANPTAALNGLAVRGLAAQHDDLPRPHASGLKPDDTEERHTVVYIGADRQLARELASRLASQKVEVIDALQPCAEDRLPWGSSPPFLFLVDYDLPAGRGDFFVRRIAASDRDRRMPLIALTARQETALQRRLINLGARLVLPKPPAVSTLAEEILCQKSLAATAPATKIPPHQRPAS